MFKTVWKIERNDKNVNVFTKVPKRACANSCSEALAISMQDSVAYPAHDSDSFTALQNFEQVQNNRTYQIEAERKRAMGIIYSSRIIYK